MCIALPMKVDRVEGVFAWCSRVGRAFRVDLSLIDPVKPGDWLLVFQDRALRPISAEEAEETEAALRAAAAVMEGDVSEENIRAGFGDLIDREPPLPPHLQAMAGRKAAV